MNLYKSNILIPNIGRRGYLVDYIKAINGFDGKVYVSDCVNTASGLYGNNDGYFILPRPVDDEKKYIQELINLCIEKDISIIIPVIDPEIYILSGHRKDFFNKGINVIVSDRLVLDVCYDKIKMNEFLEENGFEVLHTYTDVETFKKAVNVGTASLPVIMKPILGSGSVDTYKVDSIEQVESLFKEGMMIQEYVDGEEYGVDTLNNLDGVSIRCVVKKKISMRSGETDKAIIVKDNFIQSITLELAKRLKHVGNLDADIIVSGDKCYFIDLNPRFGGGFPATYASGENYLEYIIRMCNGEIIEAAFDQYNFNILVMKAISVCTHILSEKEVDCIQR